MLTVQKSYGIVQRILRRLTSLKMANLQALSPLGERGQGVRGSLANAHSGSIVKN